MRLISKKKLINSMQKTIVSVVTVIVIPVCLLVPFSLGSVATGEPWKKAILFVISEFVILMVVWLNRYDAARHWRKALLRAYARIDEETAAHREADELLEMAAEALKDSRDALKDSSDALKDSSNAFKEISKRADVFVNRAAGETEALLAEVWGKYKGLSRNNSAL
jgi:hypothetical protein